MSYSGSPPGSPVPGILQARTLEWVALSFSNAWKWKVKVKSLSHVRLLVTPWTSAHQVPPSIGFSRQEYWSGVPLTSPSSCHRPLQIQNFLNDRRIFVIHNEPLSTTDNTSVYANEITLDRDPRQLYSGSWPSERPNMELEGWNFQVKALKSGEVRRGWRLSSIKVLEHWDS